MRVGVGSDDGGSLSSVSTRAPMSCPSISNTRHPKASQRLAIGSMAMISSVGPSSDSVFLSMIATILPSLKWDADGAASQTIPSFISPSPIRTKTRQLFLSIRAVSAIPTATESPCPSDPVLMSQPGIFFMSGCIPKGLSRLLKVLSQSGEKNPWSASTGQ